MNQENRSFRERFRQELNLWKIAALPGLMVIGLVIFLRLLGLLQSTEWWALDYFLRLRPNEPTDEHLLIVGIDEEDIQTIGTYPIPDAKLAELLETLESYQPRVIGLDLVRDISVEPGHKQLVQAFHKHKNVIGIEKALPDARGKTINPPPTLPPEQVGFADLISDTDGSLRRALVGTPTQTGSYKFSFALALSERYLADAGFVLENGVQDPEAMRFGTTELVRFRSNSGGYVNADDLGNQFLINYRSGALPFHTVSMTELLQGKVPEEWIRDRIVLIGMTATSVGDLKKSNAVDNSDFGAVYGVESHAHIASQIINSVLQNRPWLNAWADGWEYVWILGWGVLGISLGRFLISPFKTLLGLGLTSLMLVGISYAALIAGWWLAVMPALLVLVLNSVGLTASLFYGHQQKLQTKIQERELVIEETYTKIHNNPIQILKNILKNIQDQNIPDQLVSDLERLEQELIEIEESVRQATLTQSNDLYLNKGVKIDLQNPLDQILREVYRVALSRTEDFPHFATIKFPVLILGDIENRRLLVEQKRGICQFVEEALGNAGKYAEGMTRLELNCETVSGWNIIRITDNGVGMKLSSETKASYGSRRAINLARQLGGHFSRTPNSPTGVICELSYPVNRSWLWFFKKIR